MDIKAKLVASGSLRVTPVMVNRLDHYLAIPGIYIGSYSCLTITITGVTRDECRG